MGALDRRYAVLGWVVWRLAKRRLRQKLRPDGAPPRGRVVRAVAAVAVLAALAAVWAKRAGHGDGSEP